MSSYKCVLLILFLTTTIGAQQKAGTLKLKPYVFETNDKKEKVDAEFGTLFVPEKRSCSHCTLHRALIRSAR